MLENFVTILRNQYEAAMSTVNRCLRVCTPENWEQPIANLSFSQTAFHTLFFTDMYLHEANDESFKQQRFHELNQDSFRDYEEMQDKPQEYQYDKAFVESYLQHCLEKMRIELARASEEWLLEPSPFPWIRSTRSEVHLYNIRHIQHHAAQMILRFRQKGSIDFPWYMSGWTE
jgi:uncharacterized damage-inducible protein DinB